MGTFWGTHMDLNGGMGDFLTGALQCFPTAEVLCHRQVIETAFAIFGSTYASADGFRCGESGGWRMPINGEINKEFGVYRTVRCGAEIVIREGSTFPTVRTIPNSAIRLSRVAAKLPSDQAAP